MVKDALYVHNRTLSIVDIESQVLLDAFATPSGSSQDFSVNHSGQWSAPTRVPASDMIQFWQDSVYLLGVVAHRSTFNRWNDSVE